MICGKQVTIPSICTPEMHTMQGSLWYWGSQHGEVASDREPHFPLWMYLEGPVVCICLCTHLCDICTSDESEWAALVNFKCNSLQLLSMKNK